MVESRAGDAVDISEVVALAHLGDDSARVWRVGVGVVEGQYVVYS